MMSYKTKQPSIKLILSKNLFNKLINILDSNIELNVEEENFSKVAEKMKSKLLQYSMKREIKNEEYVDVRFFLVKQEI